MFGIKGRSVCCQIDVLRQNGVNVTIQFLDSVFLFSSNSTFQSVLFLLYYSNLPILFIKKWQIMLFIHLELRLRQQDSLILITAA